MTEHIEPLKSLGEITMIDQRHVNMAGIHGRLLTLDGLRAAVSDINLHEGVPSGIRNQFNIIRNTALYTYFHYSLAPIVQGKTYILIEQALKLKTGGKEKSFLKLLNLAVKKGWVRDKGFRHLENPSEGNKYCREMVEVIYDFRNDAAHGSNLLLEHCLTHINFCADYINQVFQMS